MIAYDLECQENHVFEGWFENSDSFRQQSEKGLVSCPVCGSTRIVRKMSTFGIVKKRGTDSGPQPPKITPETIVQFVRDNFEDVGSDFAKEALKIHYGAAESRNIRGVSSTQEEETLREEGVNFLKIALPVSSSADEE